MYETEKRILEAALFMSSQPLSVNALTKILAVDSSAVTLKVLEDLVGEFNSRDDALEIISVNDRYLMRVRQDLADRVSHLAVSPELSKAVLKTLGLVAVKQPVKQSVVVKIVGNKAYDYIKELRETGLVHSEKAGNTRLLTTTRKFEDYFGKTPEEIQRMASGGYSS